MITLVRIWSEKREKWERTSVLGKILGEISGKSFGMTVQ